MKDVTQTSFWKPRSWSGAERGVIIAQLPADSQAGFEVKDF